MPIISNGSVLAGSSVRKRIEGSQTCCPVTSPMNCTTCCAESDEQEAEQSARGDAQRADRRAHRHEDAHQPAARRAHRPQDRDVARLGAHQHDQRRDDVERGHDQDDREHGERTPTRSTASASNSSRFIWRQSTSWPLLPTLSSSGAEISPTLSGSLVLISTIADRVAEQQQGLRVLHRHDDKALSIIIDADLEDRADRVADRSRTSCRTAWRRRRD